MGVLDNTAASIVVTSGTDLGTISEPPTVSYTVYDTNPGETFGVDYYLDVTQVWFGAMQFPVEPYESVVTKTCTFTMSSGTWYDLWPGSHTIILRTVNGTGLHSQATISFIKPGSSRPEPEQPYFPPTTIDPVNPPVNLPTFSDNEVVKIPFAYNEGDKMINYCDLEFEIYEKAARAGLSQYFASLRIVGSIEDVTVYAQEFCEPDDFYESSIESIKKAEDIGSNLFNSEDALAWAGEFIETYGESEFVRLCNFLDKKGVNDLHSGNIGRRMNGQLCLIDFSGYYG